MLHSSLCASLHLPRSPGFWSQLLGAAQVVSPNHLLSAFLLPGYRASNHFRSSYGTLLLLRYCLSSHSPECISFRREMRCVCSLWKPLNASPEKASGFSSQFYAVKEFREKKRSRPRSHMCENEDPQAGFSGFKV